MVFCLRDLKFFSVIIIFEFGFWLLSLGLGFFCFFCLFGLFRDFSVYFVFGEFVDFGFVGVFGIGDENIVIVSNKVLYIREMKIWLINVCCYFVLLIVFVMGIIWEDKEIEDY